MGILIWTLPEIWLSLGILLDRSKAGLKAGKQSARSRKGQWVPVCHGGDPFKHTGAQGRLLSVSEAKDHKQKSMSWYGDIRRAATTYSHFITNGGMWRYTNTRDGFSPRVRDCNRRLEKALTGTANPTGKLTDGHSGTFLQPLADTWVKTICQKWGRSQKLYVLANDVTPPVPGASSPLGKLGRNLHIFPSSISAAVIRHPDKKQLRGERNLFGWQFLGVSLKGTWRQGHGGVNHITSKSRERINVCSEPCLGNGARSRIDWQADNLP